MLIEESNGKSRMERKIDKELRKVVGRSVIATCCILILHVTIFFISAGRLDLYQAWFYFSVVFVYLLLNIVAIAKFSPDARAIGFVLYIVVGFLMTRTMTEKPHFETTVRI